MAAVVTCLCCGEAMEVEETAKGKPYLRCDPCGIQVFIRGRRGVEFFERRFGSSWRKAPAPPPSKKPAAPAPATPTEGGEHGGQSTAGDFWS